MTSFVGNHGLFAVALLMFVAAVLPAASEVTMLYGGALASGALAGHIALGGHHFKPGLDSYLAVVVTGVIANLVGACFGWALGAYGGHGLLERHGLEIIRSLVYTASLAEKRPHYHFRSWYSKLVFYALHYADAWTGRGNRLLVWCRAPQ